MMDGRIGAHRILRGDVTRPLQAVKTFGVSLLLGGLLAGTASGAKLQAGTYNSVWSLNIPRWAPPTLELARVSDRLAPEYLIMDVIGDVCTWKQFKEGKPGEWTAQDRTCRFGGHPSIAAMVRIHPENRYRPVTGAMVQQFPVPGAPSSHSFAYDFRAHHALAEPPVPVCSGSWKEPGGDQSMRFFMSDEGTLLDITWDGHTFADDAVIKATGNRTGSLATFNLVVPSRSHGHEWLDFHASGAHGARLDQAYIRRNHVTLNPRSPIAPASCS